MEIIHEAGFPIWFVLGAAALSLVQALRYRTARIRAPELCGAIVVTLLIGALATAVGAQLSFAGIRTYPDPSHDQWVAWIGLKESLCNFDVACALSIVAVLLATVGRGRTDSHAGRPAAIA
jgi:hypothetical protein